MAQTYNTWNHFILIGFEVGVIMIWHDWLYTKFGGRIPYFSSEQPICQYSFPTTPSIAIISYILSSNQY